MFSIHLQISQISNDLRSVQHKLNVPKSSNVPSDVKEFSENVANWISDLNDTVAQLKQSENRLQDDFQTLKINVTSLKVNLKQKCFLYFYLCILARMCTLGNEHIHV